MEQYHAKNWSFQTDNAHGSSPQVILESCKRAVSGKEYDLILCFIDLDQLKLEKPIKWEREKTRLEELNLGIKIIWQIDNAEDEYKSVLGRHQAGKHKINILAVKKIRRFVNSDFWKRILKPIKEREEALKRV
jgi:hypothetical protein